MHARSTMLTFTPRVDLHDRIVSIDLVESDGQEAAILPRPGAVLGLQTRGRVRAELGLLSTAGVTGIQSTLRRYEYLGATESLLVRFTPQGAACLGVPASELASRSLGLDDILPPAHVRALHERMHAAANLRERVAVLEGFLGALPFTDDPLIGRALELVAPSSAGGRVARAARELGLSERQLERRFLARVGVTPKRFAALRRLERAVALARTAGSLTEAALEAGYYDQAHFNRDFRRFTGTTPRAGLHDLR